MPPKNIPFEIHLTTSLASMEEQQRFVGFCKTQQAKPILIELARGHHKSQPLLSKTILSEDLASILDASNRLSAALKAEGFEVKRLKIEVPSADAGYFMDASSSFENYFEWHGKIRYTDLQALKSTCEKHSVHLSFNALKDERTLRFITLREYGAQELFLERIHKLKTDLAENKRELFKEESEYCIYDNNTFLDSGWLPH